jgi:hypothetical protein
VISAKQVYEKVRCYMVCSWKQTSAKAIYYKGMQLIVSITKSGQLVKGQCYVQVYSKVQEHKSTKEM